MELAGQHTQWKLGARTQDGEEKEKTEAPTFLLSEKLKNKWLYGNKIIKEKTHWKRQMQKKKSSRSHTYKSGRKVKRQK